jgi:hypothetical protein
LFNDFSFPPVASPLKGFLTVTIGATNLTFCDLCFEDRPVMALREQLRYSVDLLSTYMIKFEESDICLSTIDAGMSQKVSMEFSLIFIADTGFTNMRTTVIIVFVLLIMLLT